MLRVAGSRRGRQSRQPLSATADARDGVEGAHGAQSALMRLVCRLIAIAAISACSGAPLHAEVIRCADAGGAVSYTDKACPPGASLVGRVEIPDPPPSVAAPPAPAPLVDSRAAAVQAPPVSAPVPVAAVVPQGYAGGYPPGQAPAPGDATMAGDGTLYPYPYPGGYAPAAPLPDMRPQIRKCDASGCQDTLGNHYNRAGQLDRYQAANGKTCRPIGTTTFCR